MINDISRKGLALGIIILFVGTAAPLSINGDITETYNVNNNPVHQNICSIINGSLLDLQYIYNITRALSNIIFSEYNESAGELAKGRYFGTKGELKAAEILFENMTMLGLDTTMEEINNTETLSPEPKIASKIEILERGLVIHDINSGSKINVKDCYIGSRSNLTDLTAYKNLLLRDLKHNFPIIGFIASILIPFIPRINGILDKKYNLYDKERLTHNFSYKNLKVIRKPTDYSFIGDLINHIDNNELFVYISKETDFSTWPKEKTNFKGFIYRILGNVPYGERLIWALFQPNCTGIILVDSDNKTYNTCAFGPTPVITLNRSIGLKILTDPENYTIDYYVNQSWKEDVLSYNVIGQLNGTNPNETIIISCLYDSCWCQGTGDSAIGMAIVLGIAKYFADHNIKPKCNLRFIGFCGEEAGCRGAYFYEAIHRDENITTIIDLNQLGFLPTNPTVAFKIGSNKESLRSTLFGIANETDYKKRSNNLTNLLMDIREDSGGPISNAMVFAHANYYGIKPYTTIFFAKYYRWSRHHRDGMNHMEGDVLKYFYWKDTSIAGELIWNITKYFTVNPDCWFENDTFTSVDSRGDEDNLNDSIKVTFTLKSILPHDLVMVNASLIMNETNELVVNKIVNYTVTSAGIQDTIMLTVPEDGEEGWYKCTINLYNSTGRINEILHLKDNNINDTIPKLPENPYYYLYPYG